MTRTTTIRIPDEIYKIIATRSAQSIAIGDRQSINSLLVLLIEKGLQAVADDPDWRKAREAAQ